MGNELDKSFGGLEKTAVELPGGSLFRDLCAETGSGNGIEWLMLYEDDPVSIRPYSRLLYVKVIILTTEGRKFAENGQAEILQKCNLRKFETGLLSRALAVAMTLWDSDHA